MSRQYPGPPPLHAAALDALMRAANRRALAQRFPDWQQVTAIETRDDAAPREPERAATTPAQRCA